MSIYQPIQNDAWCEIHRDRISKNLELAIGLLPKNAQFCAVLKADAYGHGISQVAPLMKEQGINYIGITTNAEARAVRATGFEGTLIRVRAATPAETEGATSDRVEEQIGSLEAAEQLHALMNAGQYKLGVHLSLNAKGMSRDGLEISTVAGQETCQKIIDQIDDRIVGMCSHFASNDIEQLGQSSKLFQHQANWVLSHSKLDRKELLIHAGSSLTLVSDEIVQSDMYRCGAILYGILKPELGFRPTMELKARVVSLGDYPSGASVGYDRSIRLEQDSRLACISIGYANGFHRNAFERSAVVIGSFLCPVVGKISMNTIVVDITDVSDIAVGDEAIIFGGEYPNNIAPEMAERQFDTIMADLYSDWGQRNPRIYC